MLEVCVLTPQIEVLRVEARSLRVPTQTGQVGLRRSAEETVLAVEPGLILVRTDAGTQLVGTAGGLLHSDGRTAHLLTPLAVTGADGEQVLEQLAVAMQTPGEEWEARQRLEALEREIVRELTPLRGEPGRDVWKEP